MLYLYQKDKERENNTEDLNTYQQQHVLSTSAWESHQQIFAAVQDSGVHLLRKLAVALMLNVLTQQACQLQFIQTLYATRSPSEQIHL